MSLYAHQQGRRQQHAANGADGASEQHGADGGAEDDGGGFTVSARFDGDITQPMVEAFRARTQAP